MFHQYFHEIFLGEKNWREEFDITEEENKFEINYCLKNKNHEKLDDFYYLDKMNKLAKKYEMFFLNKNPRIYTSKNEGKISQTREIIKNISQQDYERYKYYFISKSVFYLPDIKSSYVQYLNKFKNIYQDNYDMNEKTKINYLINDNLCENNTNEFNKKINDEKKVEIKSKNKTINKNNLFGVEKIQYLKIDKNIKKIVNSENKKINFFINRKEKEVINKNLNSNIISPKNNNSKEKFNTKTSLFIINRENYEK
jgi:hypothetical protein